LKIDKKRVRRTLYWFAAELAVLGMFLLFLTYRPRGYEPLMPDKSGRFSTFITHKLGPQYYNGMQLGEPFELTIDEDGLNDAITTGDWIMQINTDESSLPTVHFERDKAVVMASAYRGGMEFVATIEVKSWIDPQGKLNAKLESVKVGAVPMTAVAKTVAKKMYMEKIAGLPDDDIQVRLGKAILEDQACDAVFDLWGEKVRITRIDIQDKVLKLSLTPLKTK
jgi:hypothetical protein